MYAFASFIQGEEGSPLDGQLARWKLQGLELHVKHLLLHGRLPSARRSPDHPPLVPLQLLHEPTVWLCFGPVLSHQRQRLPQAVSLAHEVRRNQSRASALASVAVDVHHPAIRERRPNKVVRPRKLPLDVLRALVIHGHQKVLELIVRDVVAHGRAVHDVGHSVFQKPVQALRPAHAADVHTLAHPRHLVVLEGFQLEPTLAS
mmetsp:Transcript_9663/g.34513  ORF Transcript_9663/g.34513 Transcript_9663/m.34513 type:complete len:203 (+) Transcript_9663:2455-3063(+)